MERPHSASFPPFQLHRQVSAHRDSQREPERKGLRSGTHLGENLVLDLVVEAGDGHPSFQGNQVCTYC